MTHTLDARPAKLELRAAALARRDAIGRESRAGASAAIAERVIALIAAAHPAAIAAYRAIRSEVDPASVIEWALGRSIVVALPAISDSASLVFRSYRPGAPLAAAGYGTLAPDRQAVEVDPEVLVVPLAGFDRAGHRLGYGRGYYDRGLGRLRERGLRPLAIGLAFAAQEVDAIPAEPHDVRMDWVVTEKETIDFRKL